MMKPSYGEGRYSSDDIDWPPSLELFLMVGSPVAQAGLELTVAENDLELLNFLPPPSQS